MYLNSRQCHVPTFFGEWRAPLFSYSLNKHCPKLFMFRNSWKKCFIPSRNVHKKAAALCTYLFSFKRYIKLFMEAEHLIVPPSSIVPAYCSGMTMTTAFFLCPAVGILYCREQKWQKGGVVNRILSASPPSAYPTVYCTPEPYYWHSLSFFPSGYDYL